MEDLPKNVVREWRDWCEKPDYFFHKKFYGKTVPIGTFGNYRFPVHVFWTTDDPIANAKSVDTFWKHINTTHPIRFHKILPAQYDVEKIEHLGFFRKEHQRKLWHDILQSINDCLNTEKSNDAMKYKNN